MEQIVLLLQGARIYYTLELYSKAMENYDIFQWNCIYHPIE